MTYNRDMLLDKFLTNLTVDVKPFALCTLSKGWRLCLPGPPDVMLHFVLQGKGFVRDHTGNAFSLVPCGLVIVPSGMPHTLEPDGHVQHECRIDALPDDGLPVCRITAGENDNPVMIVACGIVSVRYGQSLGLFDHLRDILVVDLSDTPQVQTIFAGIIEEQFHREAGSEAITAVLMTQCLVHLFRRLAKNSESPLPWIMAFKHPQMAQAINWILEDPAADHTVDSLSTCVGMSRSSFAARFAAAFGHSPMKLVHHIRMQRGAHLLRESDELSIDEITHRIGFSSRSHFSRAFKDHFDVSPTAYRAG